MFEYEIVDILPIGALSIVFTGKVGLGAVQVGDNLLLKSPLGEVGVTVKSLEPSGFRHAGAKAGDNVAIVIDHLDLAAVADGFSQIEGNSYQVKSLTLYA